MFSEKLESIPNQNLKGLETYLNKARERGQKYVRHDLAAREADIPETHVLTAFTFLCDEDILQAKLKVRCPNCASSHGGVFEKQSNVPDEVERCMCGEEFSMGKKANWEVVYEIPEGGVDFFLSFDESLKVFSEQAYDVSKSYLEKKYRQLEEMENASYRGQLFDHFIGILFIQIEGVHAISRYPHAKRGEIDVLVNLAEAPDWLFRTLGHATLVENKWQKEPAELSDFDSFESKVNEIDRMHGVKQAFFISMNGFKSSYDDVLDNDDAPRIIGFTREEVEEMVSNGSAESVLRRESFP
ncbi:hypothetical protein [Haloarcula salinisoli]|uniref:Restriction endonuclease type IV Mrr domain-containing protein n=1 Tax=Haloarcula salinisoli TaxID=2487746 RepID=A0A8J7YGU0_9EURY|nr:hypothetical protein [Halomicroarcula salinisoli]MBX0305237.1 hypothetical protein [Halomicroarcula salinisoli]